MLQSDTDDLMQGISNHLAELTRTVRLLESENRGLRQMVWRLAMASELVHVPDNGQSATPGNSMA